MRALSIPLAALFAMVLVVLGQRGVAEASFHCNRIHAVMAAFNGNANVQYVEVRMDTAFQNLVGPPGAKTIEFRDAAGTLKATFTFPSNPANASTGDSILIATTEFNALASGGVADYTFSMANTVGSNGGDPLHPIQGPGGKVGFAQGFDNCDADFVASPGEVDSLAYGGATANFGSPAVALPSPGTDKALRLNNLNLAPTNNMTEYGLASVATTTFSVAQANLATDMTTPRNNSRVVLKLAAPSSVGGVAQPPDANSIQPTATSGDDGHRRVLWYTLAGLGAAAVSVTIAVGLRGRGRRAP